MNKMKASLWFSLFFLLSTVLSSSGHTQSAPLASLQVVIQDDNGSLVHRAHIYIFSRNKKKFFGTREAYGITTFDLPAGEYRVYAALTLKSNGLYDHYSSPEAIIRVTETEPTSIVLALQRAHDPEMILSDTAREKLGLSEELAKYVN